MNNRMGVNIMSPNSLKSNNFINARYNDPKTIFVDPKGKSNNNENTPKTKKKLSYLKRLTDFPIPPSKSITTSNSRRGLFEEEDENSVIIVGLNDED